MYSHALLTLLPALAASAALPVPADPFWDGRAPSSFTPEDFDSWGTSPYNAGWNLGENQAWSDVITFPDVPKSLFDSAETKPFELEINDQSIFNPSGNAPQNGFRRSELMPAGNEGTDDFTTGIVNLHFSLRTNPEKALNTSHAYELIFLETADYSGHIFTFTSGTPRDGRQVQFPNGFRLQSSNRGSSQILHEVELTDDVWHNFALQLDFNGNRLSAWYSQDDAKLEKVVDNVYNDNSGRGQYHLGILKLPTGPTDDVVNRGYQPSGIHEALTFGGVFIEKGDTVTLE